MEGKHSNSAQDSSQVFYVARDKKNYGGKYKTKSGVFNYYTKKQMKSLYPGKDFQILAEYAPDTGGENAGTLQYGETALPLKKYRALSRVLFREAGCVAAGEGEDSYVMLLKNMVLPRFAILVLCLAIVAGGVWLALNPGNAEVVAIADEDLSQAQAMVPELEEGAVDWEGVLPQDTGGVTQGIAIPGYKSITVDADKTDVKVNLLNPEGNPCYFAISLLLSDGTVLYQSKMVEPGKGLYDITLSKALTAGEYDAVIKYETFSLNDMSPMNGAEVNIILIAQ